MNNKHWWKHKKKEDPHEAVFDVLKKLDTVIDYRNSLYQRWLSIYLNRGVGDFYSGGSPAGTLDEIYNSRKEPRMVLNATESCIATLAARIASQRPKPRFVTAINGPDVWDLGLKAEQLEKFVAGVWESQKVYQKSVKVFVDAAIFGFGAMKIYAGDKKIEFERVFPGEIIIDERGATFCEPRSLCTVKYVPSEVLVAEFSEDKKSRNAIELAASKVSLREGDAVSDYHTTDLVKVAEAWHLPSGYGSEDGKHIVCIDNYTLSYDEYDRDCFPFAFFKWDEPPIGWYPTGLVEREEPLQKQVNKLLQMVQKSMHLFSGPKYIIEEGSVNPASLRNVIGDIIEKKQGRPDPKVHLPPSMSAEVYRYIWEVYNKIFEDTGVSQLSASSKKPAGIESGIALRTLEDQESGRFALKNLAWEDFHVDLAKQTVEVGKQVFNSSGGNFKARFFDRNADYAEEIDWKNVNMERDQYELQVFPTNALPSTPVGRLATVEEMMNVGIIADPQEAKSLLRFPDLDQAWSMDTAALKDIDMQIGQMLGHGNYVAPMEYQDLELGLRRVTSALLWARRRHAPEGRTELLLQWLADARELLEPPPPPEPPMLPPGMPPEMGIPPGGPPEAGLPPDMGPMPEGEILPPGLPPGVPPGEPVY